MIPLSVLKQDYVHPEVFYHEIKKCQHFSEPTTDLIDMFHLVVKDLSMKFQDSPNKDQYALYAFSECIKNWKSFNPSLSTNPFCYFSTLAKNGYLKAKHLLG